MVSDLNHFSFKDWTKLKIPSEINPSLSKITVVGYWKFFAHALKKNLDIL